MKRIPRDRPRTEVKVRGMRKTPVPADASGRLSLTAPRSKSLSAAVWDYMESTPGFSEGVDAGRASLDAGRRIPFEDDRMHRWCLQERGSAGGLARTNGE